MLKGIFSDAFERMAKNSGPIWQPVTTYERAMEEGYDEGMNRAIPNTFDWTGNSYATIWWQDDDAFTHGRGEHGDGKATLLGTNDAPDLILSAHGEFFDVVDVLSRDGMGIGMTLRVRRWAEEIGPIIRNAAP
jgi:hypothetical protein